MMKKIIKYGLIILSLLITIGFTLLYFIINTLSKEEKNYYY